MLICFFVFSFGQYKHFIRIYDVHMSKIGKGHLTEVNDSTFTIIGSSGENAATFNYSNIGMIKTHRSRGHTLLITSLISTLSAGIIGAVTYQKPSSTNTWSAILGPSSAGEASIWGATIGFIPGVLGGSIAAGLKNIEILEINGDFGQWKLAKKKLSSWLNK